MSLSDKALILFVAPWITFGFAAALILAFLLDVQGVIAAFCLGVVAPVLTYALPVDVPLDETGFIDFVRGILRAPVPFVLVNTGDMVFVELAMDWWLGAAFGAALGLYARRRPA